MSRPSAIDAWATPLPARPLSEYPAPIRHVMERYGSGGAFETGVDVGRMIEEMDEAGVEQAILSSFHFEDDWFVTNDAVAAHVRERPDRFIGACSVDIRDPMPAIRELRRCVEDLGFRVLRLYPYQYGDRRSAPPPTDRMYWPFYVACAEYGIPVAIQVGHTGPLLPSECGRPIYLDEVALTFPELTIIGTHVGDPWAEEMMILAWKHPNVYLETSARPARHWTPQLRKFAATYGREKVLWGTDYPLLPFGPALDDVVGLGLPDEALELVLGGNVRRILGLVPVHG